jgi:hypothetical protein
MHIASATPVCQLFKLVTFNQNHRCTFGTAVVLQHADSSRYALIALASTKCELFGSGKTKQLLSECLNMDFSK